MTVLADRRRIGVRDRREASRSSRLIPLGALLLDVAVLLVALPVAVAGRNLGLIFSAPVDVSSSATLTGPIIFLVWIVAIALRGGYAKDVFGAGTEEFRGVLHAGLLTAGLAGVGTFIAHYPLSRGFFLILFLVGIPGMLATRVGLRRVIQAMRRRGSLHKSVLIVGSPLYVDEIAEVLQRETWLGLSVVGALTPPEWAFGATASGVPIVGSSVDVTGALTAYDVDVLFLAPGAHTSAAEMREVVWELEQHDVELVVAPSMTDISSERVKVRPVGGLPLIHVSPPTWSDASRWGKRIFDVAGALMGLLLLSPLLLAAALWVKVHDGGPVLFRQTRIGRQGSAFSCLKFRSMVTDAESLLQDLSADSASAAMLFKMKDDPRVTRPGRVLRRFSIDEMPQLVNVLRGDMSLVGPRPPLPAEVSRYQGHTARRLHVRPGITGLWQVSGRSDLSWDEAIRLDLYYVDNWSMLQDLSILLKTVGAVFTSRGAY